IWKCDYTKENVEEIFSKSGKDQEKFMNEYDKFISQPIELLDSSKVLKKEKKGNRNFYTVNDLDKMQYIYWKEKNNKKLLLIYIKDNKIWHSFRNFFEVQTQ